MHSSQNGTHAMQGLRPSFLERFDDPSSTNEEPAWLLCLILRPNGTWSTMRACHPLLQREIYMPQPKFFLLRNDPFIAFVWISWLDHDMRGIPDYSANFSSTKVLNISSGMEPC
jgi:hypothetical protein